MASFWDQIGKGLSKTVGSDPVGGITNFLGLTSDRKISTPKTYQVDQSAYKLKNYEDNREELAQQQAAAAQRQAPTIGQTMIDQSIYNQTKGKATGIYDELTNRFNRQLSGEAPSLAQNLYNSAAQDSTKRTLGAIAGTSGLNPALAARLTGNQMAMAGQANAQEAANLRIKEEQRALENMLATAQGFGQISAQDAALAQQQANLLQNANISNQQASLQQTGMNDALTQYLLGQKLNQDKLQTDYGIGYQQDRQQGSIYDANNALRAQELQNQIALKNQEATNNLWGQVLGGWAYKNGYAGK